MPPTQEDIEWFKSTFHPIPRPKLPEDCIEYCLYLIPSTPKSPSDPVNDETAETQNRLREVQRTANNLIKTHLKEYIWQRQGFVLEISKEDGISLLRGRTEFGDSIEDEWVVVYVLRELTKQFKDLWVKVTDSDGEFLLVEAAGTLPAWLEPENAENRVWVNHGKLVIIKPKKEPRGPRNKVTEKIAFEDAKKIIQEEPNRLLRSASIEAEAFYRLRNYPKQIEENLHRARVTIPRKIAYLLQQKQAYVAPAVEAFYLRDPIALKPLRAKEGSKLIFPPDDLVTVSVRFPRVGYAQLKSQDFPPPSIWAGRFPKDRESKDYARTEAGMKLASGFEMLLSDPQNQDKANVREIKLLLEDIETGDEQLPTDVEIEKSWDKREDDESWLDIRFEDLENELKRKGKAENAEKPWTFGDQTAQENLRRIVARFEEFLNDDSAAFDGAELIDEFDSDEDMDDDDDESSSDGEDKEASFDEEEFSRMMKEMMGMPAGAPTGATGRPMPRGRVEELDSAAESEDDSEQIKELSRQMEEELRGTGVLDLNRGPRKAGSSQKPSVKGKEPSREGDEGTVEDLADEDIDFNLAKNLLESLRSQAGAAGPGGNLMGLMGMNLPRDDREK